MRSSRLLSINWLKEPGIEVSPMRGELFPHLVVFIACFCILIGAFILTPADSGTPYVRLGGVPIPNVCTIKNLTGLPCPGCGLARSIVAGIHGDVGMSLTYHRLGLLTLYYVCLQFVYSLIMLVIPRWRSRIVRYGKFLNKGIIVLGILFMLNWILTLLLPSFLV